MKTIELGDIARDTITGFTGVVIAKTDWLHSCCRITLQPKELKDGKPVEAQNFDEPQLELIDLSGRRKTTPTNGGPGDRDHIALRRQ
jgi:hypothetical protein